MREFYDRYHATVPQSHAHATFCEYAYGKNLAQHGFVTMEQLGRMIEVTGVNAQSRILDLGCGDGRIVIRAASRFGCRGVGVDLNPERVSEARANARRQNVASLTSFEVGDVFSFDFSPATVVTMYLLPSVNLKLRPRLQKELRPGSRIVSHDFDMGNWAPEATRDVGRSRIFLWTVPTRS